MINSAIAQTAEAASAPSLLMNMAPMALVFLVFYFLMIRPQKKKMEQEKQYLSALKKGDEVLMKSGMIGRISGMTDKVVTLEVENGIKLKFLRSQVAGPYSN